MSVAAICAVSGTGGTRRAACRINWAVYMAVTPACSLARWLPGSGPGSWLPRRPGNCERGAR
jgi:hypothetical protein